MRLRSHSKKLVDLSPLSPPPSGLPASPPLTRASSKPPADGLVEDAENFPVAAPVDCPRGPPTRPLKPLAMAAPKALPDAPAIPSTVYRSAYTGIFTTNSDGSFQRFVSVLDQSHKLYGYWRFHSDDDERRAHVRGFSKPEDVLIAQDRSDGTYDEILMRWVYGTMDPNLDVPLFGSAADHLKTIYEMRRILGKPMSIRGRIPLYPTTDDVRIQRYFAQRFSMEAFKAQIPPVNPESSPPLRSGSDHQARFEGTLGENRAQNNSLRFPRSTMSASNYISTPPLRTVSPLAPPKVQESGDTMTTTGVGLLTTIAARLTDNPITINTMSRYSTVQPGVSQFNLPVSSAQSGTHRVLQVQPPPSSDPIHQDTDSPSIESTSQSEHLPLTSPTLRTTTQISPYSVDTPCTLPSDSTPATPLRSTFWSKQLSSGHSQTANLADSVHKAPEYSIIDPSLFHPRHVDDDTFENLQSLNTQDVTRSDNYNTSVIDNLDLRNQLSPREQAQSETGHGGMQLDEDIPQYGVDTNAEQPADKTPGTTEARDWFLDVPCMDCGLDDGHKSDCHIGDLKPMTNLTVLDHRNLAEAVERFDPGPWTTHYDQFPQKEAEDPDVQMQGMAETIRNEDSYKNHLELHGLPDEFMILMWAFKTSSNVEVVDGWI